MTLTLYYQFVQYLFIRRGILFLKHLVAQKFNTREIINVNKTKSNGLNLITVYPLQYGS